MLPLSSLSFDYKQKKNKKMNKFIRLKEDHLEARKAKDEVASKLLGTLKGEVETEMKNSDELSEDIVERIAKKFKKGLESTPTEDSERELEILKPYLKEQLTEEQIISELDLLGLKELSNFGAKMGKAMFTLKGKVDGNTLSRIIRDNY